MLIKNLYDYIANTASKVQRFQRIYNRKYYFYIYLGEEKLLNIIVLLSK